MITHPYSYCQPQNIKKFKQQKCKIGKKEKKMSLSIDDIILHIESLIKYLDKLQP